MGAKATTCCSATDDGKCCKGSAPGELNLTVGAQNNTEVMGMPPVAPPGVGLKAALVPSSAGELTAVVKNNADNAKGSSASSEQEAITRVSEDGSKYTGQIVDGLRHGNGVEERKIGSYDGQWEADEQHGRGKQVWNDGRTFEGQFSKGKFDGYGRMVWNTAKGLLVYEGEYKVDLKHGTGKFSWGDGRIYDGEWHRGMRHGRGVYTNASGQEKTGYWVEDKFDHWDSPNDVKP